MSYKMTFSGYRGLGIDDLTCPQGEQFDFTSMQCVTAGQAITPVPPIPSQPPPIPMPTLPPPAPPPPPPAPPPTTGSKLAAMIGEYAPWLVGAAVVVAGIAILAPSKRATPNKRRRAKVPPHKHKCVCFVKNKTKRARLDADRTARPLTRIVHHPRAGDRVGPGMPLYRPEYEDERGRRTSLTKSKRRSSKKNKRTQRSKRPPKKWFKDCVREVRASGSAADPRSVCGSSWYHKMSRGSKLAAKRRSYGR